VGKPFGWKDASHGIVEAGSLVRTAERALDRAQASADDGELRLVARQVARHLRLLTLRKLDALALAVATKASEADPVRAEGYRDVVIDAPDLVERAVRNAGRAGDHPFPRWSWVASAFGLGSTSSIKLCRRFELDPDEMVGAEPDEEY